MFDIMKKELTKYYFLVLSYSIGYIGIISLVTYMTYHTGFNNFIRYSMMFFIALFPLYLVYNLYKDKNKGIQLLKYKLFIFIAVNIITILMMIFVARIVIS